MNDINKFENTRKISGTAPSQDVNRLDINFLITPIDYPIPHDLQALPHPMIPCRVPNLPPRQVFTLEKQPDMYQRKAYSYETRYIQPVSIVIVPIVPEYAFHIMGGHVCLELVDIFGFHDTVGCLIGTMSVALDMNTRATFSKICIMNTPEKAANRLHFQIDFLWKGVRYRESIFSQEFFTSSQSVHTKRIDSPRESK